MLSLKGEQRNMRKMTFLEEGGGEEEEEVGVTWQPQLKWPTGWTINITLYSLAHRRFQDNMTDVNLWEHGIV